MARGKREDLTGQRFGRLVVISYNKDISKQKKGAHWNCKCDCGNEKVVWSRHLKSGNTTSCGCYKKEKMKEIKIDLTRQRFGRLVVVGLNEEVSKQKKCTHWNCKCDCGNEVVVRGSSLRGGDTTSCGCYSKEKASERMKELSEEMWQNEEFRQMQIEKISGNNNPNWNGGITPIRKHLRDLNEQWHNDCKQQVNYTCELTGKVGGKLHTHHLKAFSIIVVEAHELHNIQIHEIIGEYTQEELHKIEEYVASWHKDNSNAVVLCKEAHDLFHKAKNKGGYGRHGNTPEQYEEFKQRYLNGEFEGLI